MAGDEEKAEEEKDTELDLIAEQELLRLMRQFRVIFYTRISNIKLNNIIFCLPTFASKHYLSSHLKFFFDIGTRRRQGSLLGGGYESTKKTT